MMVNLVDGCPAKPYYITWQEPDLKIFESGWDGKRTETSNNDRSATGRTSFNRTF